MQCLTQLNDVYLDFQAGPGMREPRYGGVFVVWNVSV